MHDLWMWSWLAAMITGVVVWGLIFYVSIRYHRRSETEIPIQTRYNLPIEIFYTIAPIMMVVVFFYFTLDTPEQGHPRRRRTLTRPSRSSASSGRGRSTTTSATTRRSDSYEPVGGEEVVHEGGTTADRPTLWLVKDQSVKVHLASPDVIHSFWVPGFLFKMDVVPGRDNHFVVTPTREGTFDGRCAELCGVYHSRMLFNVKVVEAGGVRRPPGGSRRAGQHRPGHRRRRTPDTTGLDSEGIGGEE